MNFCAKIHTLSFLPFWRENSNIWKVTQFLNKIFEFSPQNITKNLRTKGLSFRTEKSKIWKLIVWSWSKSIIKEIHLWKTTCPCQSNKMTLFAFCILKLMTLGHLQKFGCNSWTKKNNTLLCSPQCEKKIVKIWPNVQDWKLAVLHSVCKSPKMSHLKCLKFRVLVSFLSENSKMFWKWDNFGICKHCVFSCKLILKGRNSAHAIHALFQNILLRSYFMVQHKIVN